VAIRKPQQDQLRALTGGPKEQIEFVVLYNPEALLNAIHYGDQNVYVKKRELKAAVADTVALLQRKQAAKERRDAD
jgi:hypothetical protein